MSYSDSSICRHFKEAECRSLDNIGRTLAKMGRQVDAIEM